jgi:hypothetical protein
MASTFLTSIPAALILYDPVLNDTNYIEWPAARLDALIEAGDRAGLADGRPARLYERVS